MVDGLELNAGRAVGPELFGQLFDRHAGALRLYVRQWCDCPDDIVQEAFIELVALGRSPDDIVAWLYRVARNKAISGSRSARRRKRREMEAAGIRPAWFERSTADRIDADLAAAAVQSLPMEQREVVIARIWGGLSFQQIGRLIDASDSAAHRRYEAGLLAIRKQLRVPCPKKT